MGHGELLRPILSVRDIGYAEFISVFDPDEIQWELWAAKPPAG
jgi:hypothetical protein